MKSLFLLFVTIALATSTFGQMISALSYRDGAGSFTGVTGSTNVLFTTGGRYNSFTAVMSGTKYQRAAIAGRGQVWGNFTATVTTTCPWGANVGFISLRRTSGFVVKEVRVPLATNRVSFTIDDYPTGADVYEVLIGNVAMPVYGSSGIPAPTPTSCTTATSNALLTLFQPISV